MFSPNPVSSNSAIRFILPSGLKFAAYHIKGAQRTSALIRLDGWSSVYGELAPSWAQPFEYAAGHLFEHLIGARLRQLTNVVNGCSVVWKGNAVEFTSAAVPGDAPQLVRAFLHLFSDAMEFTPELIVTEISRIRLEGYGVPDRSAQATVSQILPGEQKSKPQSAPPEWDINLWSDIFQKCLRAWVRPAHATLVIAGPQSRDTLVACVSSAAAELPAVAVPSPAALDDRPVPEPQAIEYDHRGPSPACILYAWRLPWLDAYRPAFTVFRHLAHRELQLASDGIGLTYASAVMPFGHYVCGASWCDPHRASESLRLMRQSFASTARKLADVAFQREFRRHVARAEVSDRMQSVDRIVADYLWMCRLYPDAADPWRCHFRGIALLQADELARTFDPLANEREPTTVMCRVTPEATE